jgi:hypothetical protein
LRCELFQVKRAATRVVTRAPLEGRERPCVTLDQVD